jgi:plastocyanin
VKPTTRDRLVLPILLPLGILVVLGAALWGFSRVLLGLHGSPATTVALIVAAAIVGFAALAVSRPQVRGSTIGAMVGATAGVTMLAGGIALAVVAGDEGEEPHAPGGPGEIVSIVAQDIAFQPTHLTVPAGRPFTIRFDNRDTVQHNVAIYDDPGFSGEPLFNGEIVTGPIEVDYQVGPLEAGTYPFHCVVHPNMIGEIEAVEGPDGEAPEPGPAPGEGPVVAAMNLAFDTDTIELPADVPTTITLDNQEPIPHNISIYTDDSLQEMLFQGEIITGPATIDYSIPALPAGEYYFQCDVHPNMNGRVVVGGG